MTDASAFVKCRECGDAFPFATIRQTSTLPVDGDDATTRVVCPHCQNDTFDRREGPTETVREWTYRGRSCRVVRHYMGHYNGYVEFDDDDRQAGYYVENESLHGPTLDDPYTPHGGLTWTTEDETGFDCGHAYDVCLDADGAPWGDAGRRKFDIYGRRSDADDYASPVHIWTPADVAAHVQDLADRLPDRSPRS